MATRIYAVNPSYNKIVGLSAVPHPLNPRTCIELNLYMSISEITSSEEIATSLATGEIVVQTGQNGADYVPEHDGGTYVTTIPEIIAVLTPEEKAASGVSITVHNDLDGLNEGSDYHHITLSEYNSLAGGHRSLLHFHADAKIIKVSTASPADFTSVAAAATYIDSLVGGNAPSANNPICISVGPGVYIEPEIVLPPYVSLRGDTIASTIIRPDGDHDVIVMDNNTDLSFLTIDGNGNLPIGCGHAGILCSNVGDSARIHKVSVHDCDVCIDCDASTAASVVYLEYVDVNGLYSIGLDVDTGINMADTKNFGVSTGLGDIQWTFNDSDIGTGVAPSTANTIYIANHGRHTGAKLQYTSAGPIPELIDGEGYFVIEVDSDGVPVQIYGTGDPNRFKLASSYTNAINGIALTLTNPSLGQLHTFDLMTSFFTEDKNRTISDPWTPNALVGKYLMLRGGESFGQDREIASNTVDKVILTHPITQFPVDDGNCGYYIGYPMFVNAENFYCFPDKNNTGTDVLVNGGGSIFAWPIGQINGATDANGVTVQEGGEIRLQSVRIAGCKNGIYVPNTGSVGAQNAPVVDVLTAWIDFCSNASIKIDNIKTGGQISGDVEPHDLQFDAAVTGMSVLVQSETPGGVNIIGKQFMGANESQLTDVSTLIQEGFGMGSLTDPDIRLGAGLNVTVGAGSGYVMAGTGLDTGLNDTRYLKRVDWEEQSIACTANALTYLSIDENGILYAEGSQRDMITDIPMGAVWSDSSNALYWLRGGRSSRHGVSYLDESFRKAIGALYYSGSIVSENVDTDGKLDISSGVYYFSIWKNTTAGSHAAWFYEMYKKAGGVNWNNNPTSIVNVTDYDDGTGTLHALGGAEHAKHALYVSGSVGETIYSGSVDAGSAATTVVNAAGGMTVNAYANYDIIVTTDDGGSPVSEMRRIVSNTADTFTVNTDWEHVPVASDTFVVTKNNETYALVLGQTAHANLNAAQTGVLPNPPSSWSGRNIVLVASIITDGAAIVEIRDERPVLSFRASAVSGVTAHGDLTGLTTGNDHPQYLLVSGATPMTGALNMGTKAITNVGLIDGVDVSSHASRHLPNGTDALTVGTPSTIAEANYAGVSNSFARQDHVHDRGDRAMSVGVVFPSDGPAFSNNGDGTVSFGACDVSLRSTADHTGKILNYHIDAKANMVVPNNVTSYMVIDYNGGGPGIPDYTILDYDTANSTVNDSNNFIAYSLWRVDNYVHSRDWDALGRGLSNKLARAMFDTHLYMRSHELGLLIAETPLRTITVTSAKVYRGTVPQVVNPYNSTSIADGGPGDLFTHYYNVGGVWDYEAEADGKYDNLTYDDGTDLIQMTDGYYGVRWFYRSIGDVKEVFYVCGDAEYETFAAATLAQPRIDLPDIVSEHCVMIGRAIIQKGASIGVTESSFVISFTGINVIKHNETSNIQGGTTDDRQHLTTAQLSLISGATSTPTASSIPISTAGGTLDAGWIPTLNQNTTGSAGSLKSTVTTGLLTVSGMASGQTRLKTVRDANDTLLELGGSYSPTGTWNWVSGSPTVTWPTFNQNTTGSAATLTTPRAIYGNSFDGSAALDHVIASTYGGTGNGFTKFTGPATSEKTFTLPNSNATIMTLAAVETITGAKTFGTIGGAVGKLILAGSTSGSTILNASAVAGSTTVTLPGNTCTLLATDGSAADLTGFPIFNQDTTGSAGSLKSTLTTGLMTVSGMASSQTRHKIVRDADDTVLELGGSYTPTATWNWTSATVTWPTFNQNTTGTATNATNTTITNDVSTSSTVYPTWVTANTGNLPQKVSDSKLSFVPSTGTLTASFLSAGTLTSTVSTGTSPLAVSSTTRVTNLNSDKWDSLDAPANAAGYLYNDGAGNTSWGAPSAAISYSEVSATTPTTTATALQTSMTLTPGAGTYIANFSTWCSHNTNGASITFSIYANGNPITHSTRTWTTQSNNSAPTGCVHSQAVVTVAAGQAIDVRWTTSAGVGTCTHRSLNLIRVA